MVLEEWCGMSNTYLSQLMEEKQVGRKNGLLDYTNIMFAYHNNQMEGSTLTISDIESLYFNDYVSTAGHRLDDLMKGRNHFKLFAYMLNTIDSPLTEKIMKDYHKILIQGTMYEMLVGATEYRMNTIAIDSPQNESPNENIPLLRELLKEFNSNNDVKLINILTVHHYLMASQNGMISRLIMFRQCLTNNVTPFIVSSDRRKEYMRGLKFFQKNSSQLMKEVLLQQEEYKNAATAYISKNKNYI